jgi:hypothetical protein
MTFKLFQLVSRDLKVKHQVCSRCLQWLGSLKLSNLSLESVYQPTAFLSCVICEVEQYLRLPMSLTLEFEFL